MIRSLAPVIEDENPLAIFIDQTRPPNTGLPGRVAERGIVTLDARDLCSTTTV